MSLLTGGDADPEQLVSVLAEVREGIRQKVKERRYLQAFRQNTLEFLNRYNNVRQRVMTLIARSKKQASRPGADEEEPAGVHRAPPGSKDIVTITGRWGHRSRC